MEELYDPGELASQLDAQLKDQLCVVKLVRGHDHLGMARMEVEDVYVDRNSSGSAVLRVVGRHTDGVDHAMLGLPVGEVAAGVRAQRDDDHVALQAGEFQMTIHPDSQHLPS